MNFSDNIVKGFRLSSAKYDRRIIDDFVTTAHREIDNWTDVLEEALSDKLPNGMQHKLRQPRNRLFPYMNPETSRSIKDYVKAAIDYHKTKKGYVVKLIVPNITDDSRGAAFTNAGVRAPKTATVGGWVGWADDVFGNTARGDVESLQTMFKRIGQTRTKL